jgi:hypothetical protein
MHIRRIYGFGIQPRAEFASPGLAEADSPFRAGKPSQNCRFRQPLTVEGDVEFPFPQHLPQLPNAAGRFEPAAFERDDFIEIRVPCEKRCGSSFDGPSDKRPGKMLPQRASDRQRLDAIADRAQPDDQNAGVFVFHGVFLRAADRCGMWFS